MHLNLLCTRNNSDLWEKHQTFINAIRNGDSGLDIPCPEEITIPGGSLGFSIHLGLKCETHVPFWLVPRSSISKSPLRMSNNIGLIDRSYRGELIAKVDNLVDKDWKIERGTMLFQIVSFSGETPTFSLVTDVKNTERGDGGFGSTTERPVNAEQPPVSSKQSVLDTEASIA